MGALRLLYSYVVTKSNNSLTNPKMLLAALSYHLQVQCCQQKVITLELVINLYIDIFVDNTEILI